jgi:hypothetical protein
VIDVPTELTATVSGGDPSFANVAGFNFVPAKGSVLIDKGAMTTPTVAAYPFARPLFPPTSNPPSNAALLPHGEAPRASDGAIDIGAIEAIAARAGKAAAPTVGADGERAGRGGAVEASPSAAGAGKAPRGKKR